MGLIVSVYRAADRPDCSNRGISALHNTLCIVNAAGPFNPTDVAPAVLMIRNHAGRVCIVPAIKRSEGGNWVQGTAMYMFGGNYVACSDSRFRDLTARLSGYDDLGAVPIHDRCE